jgi:two-component system, OmpR family, heavy metal sensor histidine kinase CusS
VSRRSSMSLGHRLSWWLASQTLIGLGVVCAVVYGATAVSLSARQADALQQKQALLRHFLDEAAVDQDLAELKHRLDDFLLGHDELAVTLQTGPGAPLYESIRRRPSTHARTVAFEAPFASGDGGSITATLVLDTRSDEQLLLRLSLTLLVAAAAGTLLVSLGGFVLVRHGLRPVRDLVEQTRELGAETLHKRLDGSAQPEELQPLIEQFNAMLGRLARTYEQLEAFNADVAHELCTPLTTMISSTELSLRKQRTTEELREVLTSNLEELRDIAGIVHDMLFLSHADRGATARREPTASLASVAKAVAEYHEAALDEAGVGVQVVGDASGEYDIALLRRAVSNLLGNATRFATPGSTVRIEIFESAPAQVSITVVNQGETIAADHLPRLFDRFFRGDSARTHADGHHGLGLAIVAAIARMHAGHPVAQSAAGVTSIGLVLATSR